MPTSTAQPTPSPARATATPTAVPAAGILGEPADGIVAALTPLGYTFELKTASNGKPAYVGTNADARADFYFEGDPVTAMVFRQTGNPQGGINTLGTLLKDHGRIDAVQWIADVAGSMTGLVNLEKVLSDGSVMTFNSEMSGSDIVVMIALERR